MVVTVSVISESGAGVSNSGEIKIFVLVVVQYSASDDSCLPRKFMVGHQFSRRSPKREVHFLVQAVVFLTQAAPYDES
jgi:hypothetical protein